MALSNAERQARFRAKQTERLAKLEDAMRALRGAAGAQIDPATYTKRRIGESMSQSKFQDATEAQFLITLICKRSEPQWWPVKRLAEYKLDRSNIKRYLDWAASEGRVDRRETPRGPEYAPPGFAATHADASSEYFVHA